MLERFSFIIQARSGSTRLPNKILLPFYKNETILDIQIDHLQSCFPYAHIILATTTNRADNVIEEKYTGLKGLSIFRGDENNVLKRFIDAAKQYKVEHIIRICSDNPFLSMIHLEEMINHYFKTYPDYLSYRFKNNVPAIKSHVGLFAEMISLKALEKVLQETRESIYLEHVTNYIYTHDNVFNVEFIPVPAFLNNYYDKLRLTIDTLEDFQNMQRLYIVMLSKYGKNYSLKELLKEVDENNELTISMKEQIKRYAK